MQKRNHTDRQKKNSKKTVIVKNSNRKNSKKAVKNSKKTVKTVKKTVTVKYSKKQ